MGKYNMTNVRLHERAPDVAFLDLKGKPTPLLETRRGGQDMLLVFLRFLG